MIPNPVYSTCRPKGSIIYTFTYNLPNGHSDTHKYLREKLRKETERERERERVSEKSVTEKIGTLYIRRMHNGFRIKSLVTQAKTFW